MANYEPCSICEEYIEGVICDKDKCPVAIMKAENTELQLKNTELEIELKAMRGAANSYKAEIERLVETNKGLLKDLQTYHDIRIEDIKAAKSEAIKEFAERLQAKAFRFCGNDYRTILEDDLYTVLEGMVGDMATCKDCIHYDVCETKKEKVSLATRVEELVADDFTCFKNKADFVEVVRCKDCKHRYSYEVFDRDRQENYECRGCHILHEDFGENGFCSYGERRDT